MCYACVNQPVAAPCTSIVDGDTETESDDEDVLDTSCCLPACGRACCGVQCTCTLTKPLAALGRCITAGLCEWDGGHRRVEEDKARYRRCRILMATLRRAGLTVRKVRSLNRKRMLIKVAAPERLLEKQAEKMRLRIQRVDGTWDYFLVRCVGGWLAHHLCVLCGWRCVALCCRCVLPLCVAVVCWVLPLCVRACGCGVHAVLTSRIDSRIGSCSWLLVV